MAISAKVAQGGGLHGHAPATPAGEPRHTFDGVGEIPGSPAAKMGLQLRFCAPKSAALASTNRVPAERGRKALDSRKMGHKRPFPAPRDFLLRAPCKPTNQKSPPSSSPATGSSPTSMSAF